MPAKTPSHYPLDHEVNDTESGYASASSSEASLPEVIFTKAHLQFLNRQLQFLEPQGMFSFSSQAKAGYHCDEMAKVQFRRLEMVHYHPS